MPSAVRSVSRAAMRTKLNFRTSGGTVHATDAASAVVAGSYRPVVKSGPKAWNGEASVRAWAGRASGQSAMRQNGLAHGSTQSLAGEDSIRARKVESVQIRNAACPVHEGQLALAW